LKIKKKILEGIFPTEERRLKHLKFRNGIDDILEKFILENESRIPKELLSKSDVRDRKSIQNIIAKRQFS
jgi:hypothetical protein